jgi:hypothetical protein
MLLYQNSGPIQAISWHPKRHQIALGGKKDVCIVPVDDLFRSISSS